MSAMKNIQHDLKRDIHNLLCILKFIKEDEEIKDPEIKTMLELALGKENKIIKDLKNLDDYLDRAAYEA